MEAVFISFFVPSNLTKPAITSCVWYESVRSLRLSISTRKSHNCLEIKLLPPCGECGPGSKVFRSGRAAPVRTLIKIRRTTRLWGGGGAIFSPSCTGVARLDMINYDRPVNCNWAEVKNENGTRTRNGSRGKTERLAQNGLDSKCGRWFNDM